MYNKVKIWFSYSFRKMLQTSMVLSELGFSIVQTIFVAFRTLMASSTAEAKRKLTVPGNFPRFLLSVQLVRKECLVVKVNNLCSVPNSPGNCLCKLVKDIKDLFTLLKLTSFFLLYHYWWTCSCHNIIPVKTKHVSFSLRCICWSWLLAAQLKFFVCFAFIVVFALGS